MNENPTLLLIDDEEYVLETFKLLLEAEGFPVFTAMTKAKALQILEARAVDVCLVDLKMKDESGLEVSADLIQVDELLKIIILTGYPTYETAIDAIKMGIFDYISKAADFKDIIAKINKAAEARRTEIAAKKKDVGERHSIILICRHMMVKEGFENFCREHPEYHLTHNYHSIGYIKNRDFNNDVNLALICSTCNESFLNQAERTFSQLNLLFPNARQALINCELDDDKKMRLIKMGVKAFLPKNIFKENMHKAFKSILDGQIWVSRHLTHALLSEYIQQDAEPQYKKPKNAFSLSNREIEILDVIASGLSNHEISEKLFISEKTVKAHINHIFKKMKVKSRTQAAKKASEANVI
ncbi:MAG: response regulator [bacterium]|nr:response regulator [bacterium]